MMLEKKCPERGIREWIWSTLSDAWRKFSIKTTFYIFTNNIYYKLGKVEFMPVSNNQPQRETMHFN